MGWESWSWTSCLTCPLRVLEAGEGFRGIDIQQDAAIRLDLANLVLMRTDQALRTGIAF